MDLMIDLETLGTSSDAPIVSIGAVFFDLETKKLGPTFEARFDLDEQFKVGRLPDASTIAWWVSQGADARALFSAKKKPTPCIVVLEALSKFVKQYTKVKVWGNGSSFDISMLESLYKDFEVDQPWLFYNVMDLRTFKRFCTDGSKIVVDGVAHDALDDAKAQAKYVLKHYDNSKLSK